jgi:hypothetical protein
MVTLSKEALNAPTYRNLLKNKRKIEVVHCALQWMGTFIEQ